MQNVAFLYLYNNRLDAIPPEISRMKGLQGIYVTGNNISRIPPEVFTMTWLRKLQVSKNHLTEIARGHRQSYRVDAFEPQQQRHRNASR